MTASIAVDQAAVDQTGTARRPNDRVVAVVYNNLCSFEFGVATELFGLRRPELDVDWYDFEVVSVDPGPIQMLGGVTLSASADIDAVATAGTIVLPGWRDVEQVPPDSLTSALCAAHHAGARIMSICSGVFVLAATGLLDGLAATTHWRYTNQLAAMYPQVDVRPDVLYVDNGSTLTSAGSAAGLDLGIHLIRRDHGAEVANKVARRLVVAPHRDGGQAQFIAAPVATNDSLSLAATIDWALDHLGESLAVNDLAGHAHMSPRTFARRFRDDMGTTPHHWLCKQRVLLAQELLESTADAIETIARRCGFGSAASLRHHFERELRTTPTRYRAAFTAS